MSEHDRRTDPAPAGTGTCTVKIVARLEESVGVASESFWATPVDASDAGGTYRVENLTFFAPFVTGDLVRCELDGDSRYQVTSLVEPTAVYAAFGVLPDPTDGSDGTARARTLAQRLVAAGAKVEFANPMAFVTCADGEWLPALLDELEDSGELVDWGLTRTPDDPVDLADVDTTLRTEPTTVPHTTSYWAPDDQYWAANGLDDPGFLAFIQDLAGSDARVARALENQRHGEVLAYLDRVAAIQRGEQVPPLDGPIFTDD